MTVLLAVLGMVFGVLTVATPAAATPDPTQVCAPLDSGKIDTVGNPASVTITAPAGMLIDGYCVKAGSANQGLGPEYVTVNPPVASLTITHSSTKDVSNYSYSWSPAPTYDYTPSATASATACTLVGGIWTANYPFSVTVTGTTLTKGTPWTDGEKAAENAKLQSQADAELVKAMTAATIDGTGASCTYVQPYQYTPSATASATACTLVVDTWTADYPFSVTVTGTTLTKGTPWTDGEKAAENAKLQAQANADLATALAAATIDLTGQSCTPPDTPVGPATVAPVLPGTVEEPTEVAVPAAATLPGTIPAGDPAPTVPAFMLALLVLGATALTVSTVHLVRTTR